MPERHEYCVAELTERIRALLEDGIGEVWVQGEISNFKRQSSGHCYFSIKDAEAQLSAVMFKWDAKHLGFEPSDGQAVVAHGKITVYAPRGNYQLRVVSLRPKGKGTLQEQFERLKRKLFEEGLFDESRKRPLPVFPLRVGVVTSGTAAALQDFLNVLGRRAPHVEVLLFDTRVQGEGAAEGIAEGVRELNGEGVDVIVLIRGGGSIEDLWSFNEEVVARAVAASEIPVVSGVGHEVDFTICDFAADLRAPTPSAAAELLCRSREEWMAELHDIEETLDYRIRDFIEMAAQNLDEVRIGRLFEEIEERLQDGAGELKELEELLEDSVSGHLSGAKESFQDVQEALHELDPETVFEHPRERLEALLAALEIASPETQLKRGYVLMRDASGGRLVTTAAAATQAGKLEASFADGRVPLEVCSEEGSPSARKTSSKKKK